MTQRLFFAFEILAPWDDPPSPKRIDPSMRHLTLAFLGNIEPTPLLDNILHVPPPPFQIGQTGFFDKLQFLPKHRAHLVSFHAELGAKLERCINFVSTLQTWLKELGYSIEMERAWLPHVTIARLPFSFAEWRKRFKPLPFFFHKLHLYESFPSSRYMPIWTFELPKPFEEIEHTADIAFKIRGETEEILCYNAFIALCFQFPQLLRYPPEYIEGGIVSALNRSLALADAEWGSPFKAVSHHGAIEKEENHLIWEMIVDV